MAFKMDTEKVADLALEPVCPRPYGYQRIDHRTLNAHTRAQAHAVTPRDRQQVIIELKARIDREAVDAGGVTEKIEIKCGIVTALLGRSAKEFLRHEDGDFSAILDHSGDGLRVPAAKLFDYSASLSIGELRHVTEVLFRAERRFYFRDLCQSSAPFFQR